MDEIKEAFKKVKNEIDNLKEDSFKIKEVLYEMGIFLEKTKGDLLNLKKGIQTDKEKSVAPLFQNKTIPSDIKVQKAQNLGISRGNEGVQTDRQTDKQTDRRGEIYPSQRKKETLTEEISSLEKAANLLDSLDGLKKEIRLKFKRLTKQEMLVFSTIYQLEEEKGFSDYKSISERLDLTESSIRDYTRRLVQKGIPLEKVKIRNKEVRFMVSPNLKKVASLNTILRLVDL
jgi:DNA-binding MarR family transcriptional regulator